MMLSAECDAIPWLISELFIVRPPYNVVNNNSTTIISALVAVGPLAGKVVSKENFPSEPKVLRRLVWSG